jgi:hypothetical protein
VSAHHGAWNTWNLGGALVDERRNLTIAVLDLEMQLAGVTLQGELASASIDVPPGLVGIYASHQRGGYVDLSFPFGAGWVRAMPASTFGAKVRFDAIDLDADQAGQVTRQVTVGINFRPTTDTALKFDLVRGRSTDEFNVGLHHARLLMSLATYF